MPAADPPRPRPMTVTVMPVPTFGLAKMPAALPPTSVTLPVSAESGLESVALDAPTTAAELVPSYTLLDAVMPVTVSASGVMFAVGEGSVIE